jgi:DNA polymerase III alpha subunit
MRIRSEYSFRYAYGKLPDVHNRVLQMNWSAAPISDRLSTFSFTNWNTLCEDVKIKPVFGVEIGVTPQLGIKKPPISYWTFFAINKLRSINDLVYQATSKSGHYPCLTYEEAIAAKDVIKITDNKVFMEEMYHIDDLFISLSPSTPIGLFREAKKWKYNFVSSSDNVFPYSQDKMSYHTLLYKDAETASYPQYILTDEEWRAALPYVVTDEDAKDAINNRNKILSSCNTKLLKAEMFTPQHEFSLREMCIIGAEKFNVNLKDPIYSERLERELSLIQEKKFEDYFYIVADLVNFAKKHMMVGPARGSAAGSLICYLTGITTIDPIKFNLLFERFIDITREDLPDIDLDFSDVKRYIVFDYIKEKYGSRHVARLGSVMSYRPRSILNTAGQALGIPKWMREKVADTLIEKSSADSRAMQTFAETFSNTETGRKLLEEYPEISAIFDAEDHATNAGQHAAGIAITSGDVLDYVAIDGRTGSVMCDKYDSEKLNILKIDILGVSQLSIFERCLELIGQEPKNGFLEALPLDDQKAFDVLNNKQFSGIFQANGKSLQILFNAIHADRFSDLVDITALSRPGPVASGGAIRWTRKRMGQEPTTYRHQLLEPYLKDTYGEVVYQEQVMTICRDIGKMDFRGITKIRKAMSKSLGVEEMKTLGEPFKKGALEHNIPENIVDVIWGELIEFGAWGFNLSHAVSYGLITYYCCWLKAHYPLEFAAATLDNESDAMKQLQMLRELDAEGVKYKSLDKDYSTERWNIKEENDKKILIGPLTNINGIGPVSVRKILESRQPNGKILAPGIAEKLRIASTKIDSLTPIRDAIDKMDLLKQNNIISPIIDIRELDVGMHGIYTILAFVTRIQPRDWNDLHSIAKRGYALTGQSWVLNLFVHDDSDEILCVIKRYDYLTIGKQIEERGGENDVLYAIQGFIPSTFRMIDITRIRYLGRMSDLKKKEFKVIGTDHFGEIKVLQ